jgi:hypothetical protein
VKRIIAIAGVTVAALAIPGTAFASTWGNGSSPLGTITFDVSHGSSTFREISGPAVQSGEQFSYDGQTFTVDQVAANGNSFTATVNGQEYVNQGQGIHDATAELYGA